jgi:hypothetical protein
VLRRWSLDVELARAGAGLLDEDQVSSKSALEAVDDFKLITGIKQGIERRLHNAGIMTYAQLAALSPDEIIERLKLSGIAARNVNAQDWVGQAHDLATHMAADDTDAPEPATPEAESAPLITGLAEQESATAQPIETQYVEQDSTGRQHYATFTVELLLGEESEVRRTRVKHIQEGEQETWAGWEDGRLVSFFVEHAALRQSAPETSQSEVVAAGVEDDNLLSDLYIDIAEFDVDTIADTPNNGDRLRAEIEFQLAGLANKQVADDQATYFTHVLAYMIATGETIVLAAMQSRLQPNTLFYTKTVDFAPPQVGHYQLLVTVVLSDYNSVGAAVGPKLRVVP